MTAITDLPDLCIGIIADKLWDSLKFYDAAETAAHCASVGNPVFSSLSVLLFNMLDPSGDVTVGSTSIVVTEKNTLIELKYYCKQLGLSITGTKPVLIQKIKSKLASMRPKYKCPVGEATRKHLREYKAKRVTVTTAKKTYKLTEGDLGRINYEETRNPHYRSAAPMRLYRLIDVERLHDEKRDEIKKKEERATKARETRKKRVGSRQKEMDTLLQSLGVDIVTMGSRFPEIMDMYNDSIKSKYNLEIVAQAIKRICGRYVYLRDALRDAGCELRADSRMCENYVLNGTFSLDKVVETMVEMKFLFQHTNYNNVRYNIFRELKAEERRYSYCDEDVIQNLNDQASEQAKKQVVRQWAKNRNDIGALPESLKRYLVN